MDSKLSPTPTDPSVPVPTPPANPTRRIQLDLSLAQVIGSSLAAATAAALSARLGVAGTIAGAAVISVITAVAGALYTQSLVRTRSHVRAVADATLRRTGTESRPVANCAQSGMTWAPRRLVAGALLVFALAVAGITGFELLTGHPLSSGATGTTLGELTRTGRDAGSPGTDQSPADGQPTQDGGRTDPTPSSADPSSAPTDPTPTDPTPTDPTPTEPSPEPSPPPGG